MKISKLTLIILCLILASGIYLFIPIALSQNYQNLKIVPLRDAFVLEGSPDNNYGVDPLLFMGEMTDPSSFGVPGNPGYCESYLFFNLSELKSLDTIIEVSLIIPGAVGPTSDFNVYLYLTNPLWDEFTISWNDKPTLGTPLGYFYANYGFDFPKIDISSITEIYDEISICIRAPDADNTIFYTNSRESGNILYENLPYIYVNYTTSTEPNEPNNSEIPSYSIIILMSSIAISTIFISRKLKKRIESD